jgi:predicted secreted hydrolase
MLFQLRSASPDGRAWRDGAIVSTDGSVTRLDSMQIRMEPRRSWTSRRTDARYPVEWRVRVPDFGLDLSVEAVLDAQELDVSVAYWEGAVDVRSTADGRSTGVGYLEMTGYAGRDDLSGLERRPKNRIEKGLAE